jgi:arginine exporter protein ArgO
LEMSSITKRAARSFVLVAIVILAGMIGLHYLEGMPYLDAFYFMSMLATTQGPVTRPVTAAGKVFVSVMAFVSVGSVLAAAASLFGPFWGRFWNVIEYLENEFHKKNEIST